MITIIQAWDDGVVEDVRLVELLRHFGAKAAFNLNPGLYEAGRSFGWMDGDRPIIRLSREEIPEVYEGFEVAAHSMTHPCLTDLDDALLRREIFDAKETLEAWMDRPVTGFCYPFNDFDDRVVEVVREAGYGYARGTGPSETRYPPDDPLRFHPSCHFLDPLFDARYERAKARGAKIYCEVAGFGMSGDAFHVTGPTEDGEGSAAAMTNALRDAGMNPDEVDYINAHGTSTPLGDVSETKGIKRVFGDDTRVAVSSTKSMIGHLLGAAGSVEAIFTVLSIANQRLHPTINLDNPGEGCDLDYVPHTARDAEVNAAISNSFGFGGTNGTVAFRRI